MKNIVFACLLALLPTVVSAQIETIVKGDCTPISMDDDVSGARGGQHQRRLPSVRTNWDPSRVYRQAVILVSFSDTDFSINNPNAFYNSLFNEKGFNQRQGPGCVADYLRDQSGGLFNVQFDIFGPIKVNKMAQPYANPDSNTRNFGRDVFIEATQKVIDSLQVDFTPYDWGNDGWVDQVVYVYAGLTGNQSTEKCYGHIWPNTSSFSTITTNSVRISNYTCSAEQWSNGSSCGIGTILHEYTHSLGLPDIYPTSSGAGYSTMDEWDIMDGGNFTNYGWCPPNYTALEKILLGWLTPVELTQPQTITSMKPVADGGEVYRIKHTENEWLLLENREQEGWDIGLPGKGLLIYHVDYNKSSWSGNVVNNDKNKRRCELVHADNMDYDKWYNYLMSWQKPKQYANSDHMNSYILSTSSYPWVTDSTLFVNDLLTDRSVPSAKMNNLNSRGSTMLSKSITNIVKSGEDGSISFDFMADAPKCAAPTISYENGRIHFESETEGAKFVSKVTSSNNMENESDEVSLVTQYVITVYAVADGYINSDTVTATLKWNNGKMTGENIDIQDSEYKNGDVNKDGTVDVADISAVITIMATGDVE